MSRLDPQTAPAPRVAPPEVDQELIALPAPPRGRRLVTMTLMALVVAVALLLLGSVRADIGYFFASNEVTDLGEVNAIDPATLNANTYVRIEGAPMASGMVRYSRLFSNTEYAVFPLAGQRTVFVQIPVESDQQVRNLTRREFSGRLVTFGQLGGRFSAVRGYLEDRMEMPVSSESFLIMADEPPGSYAWALGLGAICILFVLLNVFLIWRWFRPLRADDDRSSGAEAAA